MVRVRVEQEDPSTWPAFEGVELRAAGLVSVVVRREIDQTLDAAAAAALELMTRGVVDVMGPRAPAALFASRTHWPANRVGHELARRDRLWAALEREDLLVPAGVRSESEVPPRGGGGLSFAGWVESKSADVAALTALTRVVPAVCLVGTARTPGVGRDALVDARSSATSLFVAAEAHRHLLGPSIAVRCHGAFDDVEVSCDAIGHAPTIALLAAALHERLAS